MEPIARVSGFDATIWYDSDEEQIYVRTEDGIAVLPSGKRRRYHGEERVVDAYPGERVRLCILDPALATGDFEDGEYSSEILVVEQDDETPVGVHPGGLIVLRVRDIPDRPGKSAQQGEPQEPETINGETTETLTGEDRSISTREFHSLLRIIFALVEMNQLPQIHAAAKIQNHLEKRGIHTPKHQKIGTVVAEAFALARQETPLPPQNTQLPEIKR